MATKKLGEILLENQLITEQQLAEALEMQKQVPGQTVGQMLCRLGYLNESDLSYILEQTGKRQRLSDILIAEHLITNEQLTKSMALAKQESIPLDQALLRLQYIDEEKLARIIAGQYDLSYVRIDSMAIDPDVAKHISPSYAQSHRIVPIARIGSTLTLAMSYPLKLHDLKELEASIRHRIIPVITTWSQIIKAQQRLYKNQISPQHMPTELDNLINDEDIGDLLTSHMEIDEFDINEEVKHVTERDSVIVKLVNRIIIDASQRRASDIHIEPYPGNSDIVVRMRVDGRCIIYQRIPYKYKYAIVSRIKIMADLDISERRKPQDGKINFKKYGPLELELRIATMPTAGGLEDVVMRLLSAGKPVGFDKLNFSERNFRLFDESIRKPYGLILVVGPTGSGKTTTLHAAIGRINNPDLKIWTAEDPVEITQKGLRQVQVNPKIGLTFQAALRSFLRLDPDVIMVGEMRDLETASIAVEASLTGHLVLSTLHTNSAPETLTRLLDMGLDPFSFSDSLICIQAQRLARALCWDCKKTYTPTKEELDEIINEFGPEYFARTGLKREQLTLPRAVGCPRCSNTGYYSRLGLHELLVCSDGMKSLIKRKAESEAIRTLACKEGMTTLKQDGILKVFQELTDIHEVRRVCL